MTDLPTTLGAHMSPLEASDIKQASEMKQVSDSKHTTDMKKTSDI